MQTKASYNTYFFFTFLIGLTILAFFLMQPFLIPFILALILVHLFSPVYQFFLKKTKRQWLSSLLVCFLIALIIIIPVLITLVLVAGEVQSVINNLAGNPEALSKLVSGARNLSTLPVLKSLDLGRIFNQDSIISAAKSFSQGFLMILQGTYAGILHFILVLFIMFLSMFYMFIDGKKLVARMVRLLPLQEKYDQLLIKDVNSIARATIKGTVLMAILQGIIISLIFWATGVPTPIFFGILLAVASVIPAIGSALVWLPVGIGMILFSHPTEGILIFLSGIFIVGTLDNFVRPRLVGKDTQLHPLLILFSTLGGIALFGLSGFIIGPIIISLLVALWDIYVLEYKLRAQ